MATKIHSYNRDSNLKTLTFSDNYLRFIIIFPRNYQLQGSAFPDIPQYL